MIIFGSSFAELVDCYWIALAAFSNVLEDVAGADGRGEYLISLRWKLIEILQDMDATLWERELSVEPAHRLAYALEHGIRFMNMSGSELAQELRLYERGLSPDDCAQCLLSFGKKVLELLPGEIPEAQGPTGQRQVLGAMRTWSKVANHTGDDLGFLKKRFREL